MEWTILFVDGDSDIYYGSSREQIYIQLDDEGYDRDVIHDILKGNVVEYWTWSSRHKRWEYSYTPK
jgi:hypothetical protein